MENLPEGIIFDCLGQSSPGLAVPNTLDTTLTWKPHIVNLNEKEDKRICRKNKLQEA